MKRRWLCGLMALMMLVSVFAGMPTRTNAVESMTSSQEMIDVLKKMEGFARRAYWDNTQWTVGYGTRCPDDMVDDYDKETGRDITEEEAEALLRKMLTDFETEVNDFAKKYNLTFTQCEFDALVSLTYNCGGNWTRDTNGYLNIAVRSGMTGTDLIYAMSLFSKSSSDYVLIKRRLAEANMYLNGVYKAYNYDSDAYPSNYKYVYLDGNGGTVRYAIHGYDANDPKAVVTSFSAIPTGVDADGNVFVYEFAGWYTASTGGRKVELLDGSLANETVLYAQWKDPSGNIVTLPKGDAVDNLEITVTASKANVRSGPGTFYKQTGTLYKGDTVTITEVFVAGGITWGKYDGGWLSLSNTNYKTVLEELEKEELSWPREGTVTGNNVNVRSGAGTSYPMQYQLKSGDKVVITESFDDGSLLWGKLEDGNWICLSYVSFDTDEETVTPTVTGIQLISGPDRTDYVQMQDVLDLSGTVLRVNYSDGSAEALTMTLSMINSYSNAKLGTTTVKASYKGFSVTFEVHIIKATVTFLNEDGTVLSSEQYAYGEKVTEPETPVKPGDEAGEYVFAGWSPAVVACSGDATYTATFELKLQEPEQSESTDPSDPEESEPTEPSNPEESEPTEPSEPGGTEPEEEWPKTGTVTNNKVNVRVGPGTSYDKAGYQLNAGDTVLICETKYDGDTYWWGHLEDGNWVCMSYVTFDEWKKPEPEYTLGDFDGNDIVNEDDAIYLLRYVVFPDKYPVSQSGDVNGDGVTDTEDAIYLLRHVVFPDKYPLAARGNQE